MLQSAASELARGPARDDVVARAKRREPDAWAEIYDLNYQSLFRYAFARLGDREEAHDVASQVFLEALQGIDRYADRGRPLLAWLYVIARNIVADRFRRSRNRGSPIYLSDEVLETMGVEDSRETSDLLDAMRHVTAEQREVLILRFFVGLRAHEAASVMGKSEKAVFKQQVRAINALRRVLSPETAGGKRERGLQ